MIWPSGAPVNERFRAMDVVDLSAPMARSLELPDYRMARPDRLTFSTLVYEPASSIADVKFVRVC